MPSGPAVTAASVESALSSTFVVTTHGTSSSSSAYVPAAALHEAPDNGVTKTLTYEPKGRQVTAEDSKADGTKDDVSHVGPSVHRNFASNPEKGSYHFQTSDVAAQEMKCSSDNNKQQSLGEVPLNLDSKDITSNIVDDKEDEEKAGLADVESGGSSEGMEEETRITLESEVSCVKNKVKCGEDDSTKCGLHNNEVVVRVPAELPKRQTCSIIHNDGKGGEIIHPPPQSVATSSQIPSVSSESTNTSADAPRSDHSENDLDSVLEVPVPDMHAGTEGVGCLSQEKVADNDDVRKIDRSTHTSLVHCIDDDGNSMSSKREVGGVTKLSMKPNSSSALKRRYDSISKTDDLQSHNSSLPMIKTCFDQVDDDAKRKTKSQDVSSMSDFLDLKLRIYSECAKVYRGQCPTKRFAEYWERLCVYISSSLSVLPSDPCSRMRSLEGSGGIDEALETFLCSKKLKRLHNKLIFAVMKQSFKSFVPEKVMKHCKGEKFLEKKSINFVAKAPSRIHPSQVDIKRIKTLFSIDSGTWFPCTTSAWIDRPTVPDGWVLDESDDITFHATRIPGALFVEKLLRTAPESRRVSIEDDATSLIVNAVREYTLSVMRKIIDYKKGREKTLFSTSKKRGSGKKSRKASGSKPKIKIQSMDIANCIAKNALLTGSPSSYISCRLSWERCISSSNTISRALLPPNFSFEAIDISRQSIAPAGNIIANSLSGTNGTVKNAKQNDSVGSALEIGLNKKVSAEISVPKTGEIGESSIESTLSSKHPSELKDNPNHDDHMRKSVSSLPVKSTSEGASASAPSRIGGRGKGKNLAALLRRRSNRVENLDSKKDSTDNSGDCKGDVKETEKKTVETASEELSANSVTSKGIGTKNLDALRMLRIPSNVSDTCKEERTSFDNEHSNELASKSDKKLEENGFGPSQSGEENKTKADMGVPCDDNDDKSLNNINQFFDENLSPLGSPGLDDPLDECDDG